MLHLAQHELDDAAREIDAIVAAMVGDGTIAAELDKGEPGEDPYAFVVTGPTPTNALLRETLDRIYEVCQTAYARELRKVATP